MLTGDGAEKFAKQQGFEFVPNDYFQTDARRQQLETAQERAKQKALGRPTSSLEADPFARTARYGTVGCVALDHAGNLAVLGVLFEEGAHNAELEKLIADDIRAKSAADMVLSNKLLADY